MTAPESTPEQQNIICRGLFFGGEWGYMERLGRCCLFPLTFFEEPIEFGGLGWVSPCAIGEIRALRGGTGVTQKSYVDKSKTLTWQTIRGLAVDLLAHAAKLLSDIAVQAARRCDEYPPTRFTW